MLRCPVYMNQTVPGTKYQKQRVKCGKEAALYEVWGDSFCARQELCPEHADRARQEGFKLFEIVDVEEPGAMPEDAPTGS